MTENTHHRVHIGSFHRDLELYQIPGGPRIALFDLQCDVEITDEAARILEYRQRDRGIVVDAYVMPAGKATPLLQAIGRRARLPIAVAGKKKPYAASWIEHSYVSVTSGPQTLYLSGKMAAMLDGRKVAIVDDVVSTGGTLEAMKELLKKAGAEVVIVMVVFTEEIERNDVLSLGHLPLF